MAAEHSMQLHIAGSNDVAGVTYYNLQVSGSGRAWRVQRRYNDFVELDRRLAHDTGLSRIALPRKDILGILKRFNIGSFRERRKESLELYLTHLLGQVTTVINSALAQFLEIPFAADSVVSFSRPDASSELLRNMLQLINNAIVNAEQQASDMAKYGQTENEERPLFAGVYESKYALDAPDVFEGSFAEAVSTARVQKRLVLVWLFGDNPISDALCREVIGGDVFKAFASEYFVLWPGDAERWLLPMQLRQLFRLTSLPSLLVLKPLSVYDVPGIADPSTGLPVEFPTDTAWALLGAWDATSSGVDEQDVVAFLGEHGERAAEEVRMLEEQRRFNREHAEEVRRLREQQEQELEESMQKDRELAQAAELARQEAEEATNRANAEAMEKDALEAAVAAAKQSLIDRRRQAAQQYLAEQTTMPEQVCKLVIRFPDGRRMERSFDADEPIATVYSWADCCGELASLEGGDRFDVPHNFHLATTFPRVVLADQNRTLRDLQLLPSAALALVSGDD